MNFLRRLFFFEDLDGNILDVNDQACELLGYAKDQFVELKLEDIVPKGAPVFRPDQVDQATRMGKPIETVNLRQDGTEIPVELRGKVIELESEEVILASLKGTNSENGLPKPTVSLEDYLGSSLPSLLGLQSQGSVQQQMHKMLEWQEALFEGSRDGIFISDAEGKFIAVNSAARELMGYSRAELLEMTIPYLHDQATSKLLRITPIEL